MKKIKITADSTCDLPQSLKAKYDIDVVPLYVIIDGKEYQDGINMDSYTLFEQVEKQNKMATTAAISEYDYAQIFKTYVDQEMEVIHFATSSKVSLCYQSAVQAALKLPNVHVIDTQTVTLGIGILALAAAELKEQELTAKEIVKKVKESIKKIDVSCVMDTISYVRRGGRISAVAAMGVELLNLKPCIEVKDGVLGVAKKYRGKFEKVFSKYLQEKLSDVKSIDTSRIFLLNSLLEKTNIEKYKAQLQALCPFHEVIIVDVGCAIACHAGPNAVGLAFSRK